ncbi:hypothetical protein PMAC_002468 [Pneumocystis sp. 'macacae']|nr:hypothetical protein PMAC_002468 [Pneumocystis sp. 'macacae']
MIGPTFPATTHKKHKNSIIDDDSFINNKSSYVIGPSFSEFLREKRKENNIENKNRSALNSEQTETDNDEIGPRLSDFTDSVNYEKRKQKKALDFEEIEKKRLNHISEIPTNQEKKRDDWMIIPPNCFDLNSRIGVNLKSRTFNTGKNAWLNDSGAQNTNLWTETYEDKQKRLKQEAIGTGESLYQNARLKGKSNTLLNTEKQKLISGIKRPSLYDIHLKASKESADDSSKRMFDREKDIGENFMTFSKKLKIINLSKDMFQFSSGSYL